VWRRWRVFEHTEDWDEGERVRSSFPSGISGTCLSRRWADGKWRAVLMSLGIFAHRLHSISYFSLYCVQFFPFPFSKLFWVTCLLTQTQQSGRKHNVGPRFFNLRNDGQLEARHRAPARIFRIVAADRRDGHVRAGLPHAWACERTSRKGLYRHLYATPHHPRFSGFPVD
jgi:hypothetical protein